MQHRLLSLVHAARLAAIALAGIASAHAQVSTEPKFDENFSSRFGPQPPFAFSEFAGLLAQDFDGDGFLDIAATGNKVLRLNFGNAEGGTRPGGFFAGSIGAKIPRAAISEDLNGDERPDLIFIVPTDSSASSVECFLNSGTGQFPNTPSSAITLNTVTAVPYPRGIATGDFNADGFPDLVISGEKGSVGNPSGVVAIYLSSTNPAGAFTGYAEPPTTFPVNAFGQSDIGLGGRLVVGDLDGDAFPDVVIANEEPDGFGVITYYFGDPAAVALGTVNLIPQPAIGLGARHPVGIALGDLSGDGKLDIIVSTYTREGFVDQFSHSVVPLFNDGDGKLETLPTPPLGLGSNGTSVTEPRSDIALRDLNGDGELDILAVQPFDSNLLVMGTFSAGTVSFPLGATGFERLAVGDFNHDAQPDVAVASPANFVGLFNTTGPSGPPPLAGRVIQFSEPTYEVTEGAATAIITVRRGSASTGEVVVPFTLKGTANGFPKANSDYGIPVPADKKLRFAAGEFAKEITVFISNDAGFEPAQTAIFTLGKPLGDAVLGVPKGATLTIYDSELPTIGAPGALIIAPSNIVKKTAAELKAAGVKAFARSKSPWKFTVVQAKDVKAPGLGVMLQYSLSAPPNEIWQDLAEMERLKPLSTAWALETSEIPLGSKLFFRTLSSAPDYQPRGGATSLGYRVVAGPKLTLLGMQSSPSDLGGAFTTIPVTTHSSEVITYRFRYRNVGNGDATNVKLYAKVPNFSHYDSATQNNGATLERISGKIGIGTQSGTKAVIWTIPLVPAGADYTQELFVKVFSANEFNPNDATALFDRTVGQNGFDLNAKDQGMAEVDGSPEFLNARILSPLSLLATTQDQDVTPGGLITYKLTVKNLAGYAVTEAILTDRVPFGTTFESVASATGDGNFTGAAIPNPGPGTNPSVPVFTFGNSQLLTWNLGSIPAGATRVVEFTVRMKYDLLSKRFDAQFTVLDAAIANTDFNLIATPPTGGTLPAFIAPPPPTLTRILAATPGASPQIAFTKSAIGEGDAGSILPDAKLGTRVATVLPGDAIRYELFFENSGGAQANGCVIEEEIVSEGRFILGSMTIDGVAADGDEYSFFDRTGNPLPKPNHTITQDADLIGKILFRLGHLPAGANGVLRYKVRAVGAVGKVLTSRGYTMFTESLAVEVPGTPEQVFAKIVKPISFEIHTFPQQVAVAAGEELEYVIDFRNRGGIEARNVVVKCPIPVGTTHVRSEFLDANLQPIDEPPVAGIFAIGTLTGEPEDGFDDPANHRFVRMVVRLNSPLHATLKEPGDSLTTKATIDGSYVVGAKVQQPGAFALLGLSGPEKLAAALQAAAEANTRVLHQTIVKPAKLWALKTAPLFVTKGQKMVYGIAYGNSGDLPVNNVRVGMQIPFGTELVPGDTTPGYKPANATKGIITWDSGDLAAHNARGCRMVVRVDLDANYTRDKLDENSTYVKSVAGGGKKANAAQVAPGVTRTTVQSTNGGVAAWQGFFAVLENYGAKLFGKGNSSVTNSVKQFGDGTNLTTIAGADVIVLPNLALLIQNGGGMMVASGGGNIVAGGGGNLVAQGGGNLVAQGGGNIVAQGGGNLTVTGLGACTPANVLNVLNGIVAGGGGNIVASGGGNLIANDGGTLIGNDVGTLIGMDGASLRKLDGSLFTVTAQTPGIVASGGGNLVAQGGGNLRAGGATNFIVGPNGIVASGGGN